MTLLYLLLGLMCFAALFALTEVVARSESDSKSSDGRGSS
jgi:hypothetical protein